MSPTHMNYFCVSSYYIINRVVHYFKKKNRLDSIFSHSSLTKNISEKLKIKAVIKQMLYIERKCSVGPRTLLQNFVCLQGEINLLCPLDNWASWK